MMRAAIFALLCSCVTQVESLPPCGERPVQPPFTVESVSGHACITGDDYAILADWHVRMWRWANCIQGEVAKP